MSAFVTLPGFADPVDDAQAVFRAALTALSRPGLPVSLLSLPPALPVPGFSRGMLALALALCDRDTPLWLDAASDTPEARHHLRFHCAAPFTASPAEASFAFISRPKDMPRLHAFNQGRADFPDRSATLVISADLFETPTPAMELTGPGVRGNDRGCWRCFSVSGLPAWFWTDWAENRAAYPLGVDVIFVDSGASERGISHACLLGLPRTARVRPVSRSRPDSPAFKENTACTSL